jgi:hypothetical protein
MPFYLKALSRAKKYKIFFVLILVLFSCDLFDEDIKKIEKMPLKQLSQSVGAKTSYFEVSEKTVNGKKTTSLSLVFEDIRNRNQDFTKHNKTFFKMLKKFKVNYCKYDLICIYYINNVPTLDLIVLYEYNYKEELIDIFYE